MNLLSQRENVGLLNAETDIIYLKIFLFYFEVVLFFVFWIYRKYDIEGQFPTFFVMYQFKI